MIDALCAWLERLFPDRERGEQLQAALREHFDDRPVTAELCKEVERVAHRFSRHFELGYVADGSLVPDADPPGWPPQARVRDAVTGTNWEGTGVVPDVACGPEETLEAALATL